MSKVLVAYASKYGATAEMADALAKMLVSVEVDAEAHAMHTVDDLAPYTAVVAGSSIYIGQWLPEGETFLKTFKDELAARPVWLFSSGPTGDGDPEVLLGGWRFPDNLQPLAEYVKPVEVKLFHGYINVKRLNLGERLLVKAMRGSTGDYRDWEQLRIWAKSIADQLIALDYRQQRNR